MSHSLLFWWNQVEKNSLKGEEGAEIKPGRRGEWGFGFSGELQTSLSDFEFPFSQFFSTSPAAHFPKQRELTAFQNRNALVLPFLEDANTLTCQSGCHARQVSPLQISPSMILPACEHFDTKHCAAPKPLNDYLTFPLRPLCSLSASVVMPALLF